MYESEGAALMDYYNNNLSFGKLKIPPVIRNLTHLRLS